MFEIGRFEEIVDRMYRKLEGYSDIRLVTSPEEDWSIIELVSHLIDSASNNHQRFIRLQYEKVLRFPGYDAETWRDVSKMKQSDYAQLIELWRLYNRYVIDLIKRINPATLDNYWIKDEKRLTLRFLVDDYFDHLLWHERLFDEIERHAREDA